MLMDLQYLNRILDVNILVEDSKQAGLKTYRAYGLLDISQATLLGWEREGMIAGPPRDWRNWRLYARETMDEIKKFIRARKVLV